MTLCNWNKCKITFQSINQKVCTYNEAVKYGKNEHANMNQMVANGFFKHGNFYGNYDHCFVAGASYLDIDKC